MTQQWRVREKGIWHQVTAGEGDGEDGPCVVGASHWSLQLCTRLPQTYNEIPVETCICFSDGQEDVLMPTSHCFPGLMYTRSLAVSTTLTFKAATPGGRCRGPRDQP